MKNEYTWQKANEQGIYFKTNGKRCIITKYKGNSKIIMLPDKIDGKPVKAIGNKAFYRSKIEYIYIPDTVTKIGRETFKESKLKSFEFPKNIEYIDDMALYGCENLKTVTSRRRNLVMATLGNDVFSKTPFSKQTPMATINNMLLYYNVQTNVANIPSHIDAILKEAFKNRYSIRCINFENIHKHIFIESHAFDGTSFKFNLIHKNTIKKYSMHSLKKMRCTYFTENFTLYSDREVYICDTWEYNIDQAFDVGFSSFRSPLKFELRLDLYKYDKMFEKIERKETKVCFSYSRICLSFEKEKIQKHLDYLLKNKRRAIRYLIIYDDEDIIKNLLDWKVICDSNIDYAITLAENYKCKNCEKYLKKMGTV